MRVVPSSFAFKVPPNKHTHTHKQTNIHTHIRTYTHTHIRTYTHTHIGRCLGRCLLSMTSSSYGMDATLNAPSLELGATKTTHHQSLSSLLSLAVIMPPTSPSAPHDVCKHCASGRCVPMQLNNAIPTHWIACLCSGLSFLNEAVRKPGESSRLAGNLRASPCNCRYNAFVPSQWHKA